MQKFSAEIFKAGINPYVDVPDRVSRAYNRRGYIPVLVHAGGGQVRSTLVPTGEGKYRLYINLQMRLLAAADVGGRIKIGLVADEASRIPRMPAGFARKLGERPRASKAWGDLTPSRRKEILTYLNHLKRAETLTRNIDKVIWQLESGKGTGR